MRKHTTNDNEQSAVRELFIEELAHVLGGDTKEPFKWIREQLQTTYGQCEETPIC